jgi:menaquinone-dependent protoporphyrinogen oxidase
MPDVLVAYASKHGSTAEIAEAVAETLRGSGLSTDCIEAALVDSVEPYDAVVLGSAIYMGRWRPHARHFVRKHAEHLAERPFWVFSSGPCGKPQGSKDPWREPTRTIAKVQRLGLRGHILFGGCLPTTPHGPTRSVVESAWDRIRSWATGIASELHALTAA